MTSIDDIASTIGAMRAQEETAYRCHGCLKEQVKSAAGGLPVDADCRVKMIKWCYQIVDFCKFQRETVAISMSYLDRFLLTAAGQEACRSRKCYQLASMACLYMAVKLHEPLAIDPKVVSSLSRGVYTEKEITDMEFVVLTALQWRVNPPTAIAFVRLYISLMMSSSMTAQVRDDLYQASGYQTELALSDVQLVAINPSVVAWAAIANALEANEDLSCSIKRYYLNIISNAASIDESSPQVKFAIERLLRAIPKHAAGSKCLRVFSESSASTLSSTKPVGRRDSWKVSPRSVLVEQ